MTEFWKRPFLSEHEIDRPFFEEEQIIEDNSGDILLVEACKDLSTARKLAGESLKIASMISRFAIN